jgi:hypothetical protein
MENGLVNLVVVVSFLVVAIGLVPLVLMFGTPKRDRKGEHWAFVAISFFYVKRSCFPQETRGISSLPGTAPQR